MSTPRRAAVLAVALLIATSTAGAQTVDRILAVVGAAPITLSDVNAATAFGLVRVEQPGADSERAVLSALIDRQLQLSEVDRYLPPEPAAADIDARVSEVRARFPTAEAFDAALKQTGLTAATLRAHIRDSLRIETYLQQRFGAGYQPGDEEVLSYYRSHQTDFSRDGVVRTYADARDDARRKLVAERNAALVRDWITGLRRRVDVTILPR
jgi:parvulin-like peptidyl-prolyl isomerase